MKIMVFDGNLGHEKYIGCFDFNIIPNIGDFVYLPTRDEDDIVDGDTYVVKQIVIDIVHNEYNIFVELYNWED